MITINSQRAWDEAVSNQSFKLLLVTQSEPCHRAGCEQPLLLTVAIGYRQCPKTISACGLRLTDYAVRVAVGMRLGTELGQVHKCTCGASAETRGTHDFSCMQAQYWKSTASPLYK